MRTWTIYGLADDNGAIRYVGVTVEKPSVRLSNHWGDAKYGVAGKKNDWIRSIGHKPKIVVLEHVDCCVFGAGLAERKWVTRLRSDGANLLNHTRRMGAPIVKRGDFEPCDECRSHCEMTERGGWRLAA